SARRANAMAGPSLGNGSVELGSVLPGEAGVILDAEDRRGTARRQRPANPKMRVIPSESPLRRRVPVVGYLVEHLGILRQREETVRQPRRDPDLPSIGIGHLETVPAAKRRGAS